MQIETQIQELPFSLIGRLLISRTSHVGPFTENTGQQFFLKKTG